MDIGHLSQAETQRGLPRGVDFERREKFRYFGEIGWGQGFVFQAKEPNSIFKEMEAWKSIIHPVSSLGDKTCSVPLVVYICCIHFCSASFVMTFRANFQTPPENHCRYFIALTQMIFPSWVLTRFVSGTLFTHSKAIQSVFRRFKMYHYWGHLNGYVCLRTQKSIPEGQLCAKSTYWNTSITS